MWKMPCSLHHNLDPMTETHTAAAASPIVHEAFLPCLTSRV